WEIKNGNYTLVFEGETLPENFKTLGIVKEITQQDITQQDIKQQPEEYQSSNPVLLQQHKREKRKLMQKEN
ncbi:MAG: hypothetical protein ACP5PT_01760, partial [Brevinematia bacterium]